jgi:hypothetical protein
MREVTPGPRKYAIVLQPESRPAPNAVVGADLVELAHSRFGSFRNRLRFVAGHIDFDFPSLILICPLNAMSGESHHHCLLMMPSPRRRKIPQRISPRGSMRTHLDDATLPVICPTCQTVSDLPI